MASTVRRVIDLLVRYRYLVLVVVAAVAVLEQMTLPFNDDWPLFLWGSELLFGDHPSWATEAGGLHLYANYHVQIGPLTLLVVTPLRVFGEEGSRIAAMVLMTACGPLIVWLLERASLVLHPGEDARRRRAMTVLIGGAVAMIGWGEVVTVQHLDDVLTLTFGALALLAVALAAPLLAGALIGLAVASKLWGIVLLPLVLAFKGRARLQAAGAMCIIGALTWLPFVLADSGSFEGFRGAQVAGLDDAKRLHVDTRSVLALFGIDGASPSWARPTQVAIALALGVVLVRAGRWPAVLLAGVATRVLLDPLVFRYYGVGIVIAALAWELLRARRPNPAITVTTLVLVYIATEPGGDASLQAFVLLTTCGMAILAGLGQRIEAAPP
jgi:hypothetical protein